MQELEGAYNAAAGLYWIAFLLTSCSELSLALTIEALDSENDTKTLSSSQALAKARRTILEKAVASIRDELAASARRTVSLLLAEACMPPSTWRLDPNMSKHQVESALLKIDIFPRCALLLTLFEGLSLEHASTLLNTNRELLLKGRLTALYDLLKQLARVQAEMPIPPGHSVGTSGTPTTVLSIFSDHWPATQAADHRHGTNYG